MSTSCALDDAMRDVAEIHVMKIDAEGHELHVLRGAQEIIARSPALRIVMEFNPSMLGADGARDLVELVRTLGFDIYSIEHDSSLTRLTDDEAHALGGVPGFAAGSPSRRLGFATHHSRRPSSRPYTRSPGWGSHS